MIPVLFAIAGTAAFLWAILTAWEVAEGEPFLDAALEVAVFVTAWMGVVAGVIGVALWGWALS